MKQLTKVFTVILLCSIGLIACKKDYNCNCTVTVNVPLFGPISTNTTKEIEKAKEKDAKSKCNDFEDELKAEAQQAGGTASCSLEKQ